MLTVYGIETKSKRSFSVVGIALTLQQCLPFTVLKLQTYWITKTQYYRCNSAYRLRYWNALVVKRLVNSILVSCNSAYRLRYWNSIWLLDDVSTKYLLQQCLPFTVLKHGPSVTKDGIDAGCNSAYRLRYWNQLMFWKNSSLLLQVATVLTVYGIETVPGTKTDVHYILSCCNSAYRLRYWNFRNINIFCWNIEWLQQCLPFTVLKLYNKLKRTYTITDGLQQCLPFTVLKRNSRT